MAATAPKIILLPDEPTQEPIPVPRQTQTIERIDELSRKTLMCNELRVVIPVAEWYLIQRKLRALEPSTWVDPESKAVAYFRPYIFRGKFEVTIELAPIEIGARFLTLAKEK